MPSMLEESTLTAVVIEKKSSLTKAHFSQILFFEMGGMFLFTYGITCAHSKALLDLQVSLSVILGVCFSGFLCGANFNPCVSLMSFIRKNNRISWQMLGMLLLGQIIGTFMGGSFGYALNGVKEHGFLPEQADQAYLVRLMVGEAVGTFILIFFIMHLSNPNTTFIETEVEGYIILGLYVYIGRRFTPLSGMSLNIGISLVFAILADMENGEIDQFRYVYIYFVGDVVGTILATLFYDRVYEPLACEHRRQMKQQGK